jgi:predicted ATPase
MITEIYASNFRSLVNFRISLDDFTLLLGPNGSGKSAVFDVVRKLSAFVGRGEAVDDVFHEADITRGLIEEKAEQEFEILTETTEGTYTYSLTIEFKVGEGLERVGKEKLMFGRKILYEFSARDGGRAKLYRDDGSSGPEVLADWSRSGLSVLPSRHDNTLLIEFRKRMANSFVIRMNPALIGAESRDEARRPKFDLSNFASWYRYLVQTEQSKVFQAIETLRHVLPGFDSLTLVEAGEGKLLSAVFHNTAGGRSTFRLHQLSEGQRALIGLYVLLHCVPDPVSTIMVDEPENFVGLPEIQPWLDAVHDWASEPSHQAVLVSHHPLVVNFLAQRHGVWVDRRESVGFSQARKISDDTSGMSVADLMERRWVYDYVDQQ